MTINNYIRAVKEKGWQPFAEELWQRNYFERVIRNEADLADIREYIEKNIANWTLDEENR